MTERVELHLHTTASDDISVITPKDVIKTAVQMGHKAVAVTCRNSAQDFPELEACQVKYGKDIKIIYGAEVYYLKDDTAYGIALLAKNEEGLPFLVVLGGQTHSCPQSGIGAAGSLIGASTGTGGEGRRGLAVVEEVAAFLLQALQSGFDVGLLVFACLQGVYIQQSLNGLGVSTLGGGDCALQRPVKGHIGQLGLVGGVLVCQILLQLGDLALQILHIHALEGLQAILCGLELGFQVVIFSPDGTDAPAVLVQNGVDDLLGQSLIAHLEVLQEFTFHGLSFLRFALLSGVASPAVGVFAPTTAKMV